MRDALAPLSNHPVRPDPEDFRIVGCDACGSEGFESYTARVYEHGCGFAHDEAMLDYSRPCKFCEGTGSAVIPVEPITLDDLMEYSQ